MGNWPLPETKAIQAFPSPERPAKVKKGGENLKLP
jgi:hypothetical protein